MNIFTNILYEIFSNTLYKFDNFLINYLCIVDDIRYFNMFFIGTTLPRTLRLINVSWYILGRLKPSIMGQYFLPGIWHRRSPRPRSISSSTTAHSPVPHSVVGILLLPKTGDTLHNSATILDGPHCRGNDRRYRSHAEIGKTHHREMT